MAYAIVQHFKGGTKAQYDKTRAAVFPDGGKSLPKGQTYHAAGETDDGFVVVAIWDAKATYDAFAKDTLAPTLETLDGALPGPPHPMTFEVYNLQKA